MRATIPSKWTRTIVVCSKCSKRVGGGFGPKKRASLAKALREWLDQPRGRRASVGIVESGCLKLCPKGRVVAFDAAQPNEWHLVKPGTAMKDVARALE
ncbi:MAG: hypothetical protein JOY99_11765 [Sphingomonadaceae bacterium]|nr:hypothetical protein [Sphingomonadaceae bacterium]